MNRSPLVRDRKGAVAVEFALVVPIFLLLVFGMLDFARAFYTQSALAAAVREGGRRAAVSSTDPSVGSERSAVRTVVGSYVIPFGGSRIDTNNVAVTSPTPCATNPNVTVTVTNYQFNMLTPLPRLVGIPTSQQITRSATFRWERC